MKLFSTSIQVVKQTVMTIVYGVTVYGAKLQILKQLREKEGLDRHQKVVASKYLAGAVFNSLQKMFTKTREIQVSYSQEFKLSNSAPQSENAVCAIQITNKLLSFTLKDS